MDTRPHMPLLVSNTRGGLAPRSSGAVSNSSPTTPGGSTNSGTPSTARRPTWLTAASATSADLAKPTVAVMSDSTHTAPGCPVSASRPEGRSIASVCAPASRRSPFISRTSAASGSLKSPREPNPTSPSSCSSGPSNGTDGRSGCGSSGAPSASSFARVNGAKSSRACGVRTRTRHPQAARCRAATKASPALCPLPA